MSPKLDVKQQLSQSVNFRIHSGLVFFIGCQLGSHTHARTHTHTPLFNGLWSGTTRVGRYQKTINFLHLLRSIASSLFSLRAWQSSLTTSLQVLFVLPLGLGPCASYSMHFFAQSSSFYSTCPYHVGITGVLIWLNQSCTCLGGRFAWAPCSYCIRSGSLSCQGMGHFQVENFPIHSDVPPHESVAHCLPAQCQQQTNAFATTRGDDMLAIWPFWTEYVFVILFFLASTFYSSVMVSHWCMIRAFPCYW